MQANMQKISDVKKKPMRSITVWPQEFLAEDNRCNEVRHTSGNFIYQNDIRLAGYTDRLTFPNLFFLFPKELLLRRFGNVYFLSNMIVCEHVFSIPKVMKYFKEMMYGVFNHTFGEYPARFISGNNQLQVLT